MNETNVAPNNNFKPKRATMSPFSLFNDLIAPEIIPIELKLAKDTKKTETIPLACSLIPLTSLKLCIATNSLDSSFVAITEPDCTASLQGIPAKMQMAQR